MSQHQQPRREEFQPPMLSLAYAAALGWVCHWLMTSGARYSPDLSTPLAIFVFIMALLKLIKAIKDWDIVRTVRRKQRAFNATAADQGQARFGTTDDIADSEDFQ